MIRLNLTLSTLAHLKRTKTLGGGPIGPPAINKSENNKTYVLKCFLNYMYCIRPHDKIEVTSSNIKDFMAI